MDERLHARKKIFQVKVRPFSGAMWSTASVLKRNLDYIILHIGTNDAFSNATNELFHKIWALKNFITPKSKKFKVSISMITMSVDDQNCGSVVRGGVHIHIATHAMLTIFFQTTHPPQKKSNVEHTRFIRNVNLLMISFLILKNVTRFDGQKN